MLTQQYQPNRWSCMATAFAMALGIEVSKLIDSIGHDGSEIVEANLELEPLRRGFSSRSVSRPRW